MKALVIALGILAVLIVLAFTPYQFDGYNEASMIAGGRGSAQLDGHFSAPLWKPMTPSGAEEYVHNLPSNDTSVYSKMSLVKVEHVQVLWGPLLFRLGAIVAGVGVLLWLIASARQGTGKAETSTAEAPSS